MQGPAIAAWFLVDLPRFFLGSVCSMSPSCSKVEKEPPGCEPRDSGSLLYRSCKQEQ